MNKICKKCKEEKSMDDFHNCKAKKDGKSNTCKICACKKVKDYVAANYDKVRERKKIADKKYRESLNGKEVHKRANSVYRERHKEVIKSRQKDYRDNNKARISETYKRYRERNPEKVKARAQSYRDNNKEKIKEGQRKHLKHHRAEANARLWKYRASKRRAIPLWADLKIINTVYAKCSRLSKWLGEEYNVDHIVPLQSEFVCGLHCEHNLQILNKAENVRKGNRYWPDMWD